MAVLYVIAGIVYLVIDYFIANEFYKAAAEKGYDDEKYLWLSFFLGAVGWLLVVALPDRGKTHVIVDQASEAPEPDDTLPEI